MNQKNSVLELKNIQDRNDGGGYRDLGEALEGAFINALKWDQERRFPGSLTAEQAMEKFLGCGTEHFYVYNARYEKPVSFPYMAGLIPFLRENYRDMTDEVIEMLDEDSRLGVSNRYAGNFKKVVGFNFNRMIELHSGEHIDIPGNGMGFIESSDGFRHVINYDNRYGSTAQAIEFSIISNGTTGEARNRTTDLLMRYERFIRENRVLKSGVFDHNGNPVRIGAFSWKDLKLPPELRRSIQFHIIDFLDRAKALQKAGLRSSRGIILCGSPGNGKTLLGKVLASTLEVPIIQVTASIIEQNQLRPGFIRSLYRFAEIISPSILFIEDADIFLSQRNSNQQRTILSEFLNCIDGIGENRGVVTIITANNPELLDEAVANRPKRFDAVIEFDNPGRAEREAIVEDIIGGRLKEKDLFLVQAIAARLEGYSGAHVTEFAERLVMACVYDDRKHITRKLVNGQLKMFGYRPVRRGSGSAGFAVEGQ